MNFNDVSYDDFSLRICSECDGELEYKGLGEYVCSNCNKAFYNDYGKVRNYLEEHPGSNSDEVSRATGVSRNKIRNLLAEEKLELAKDSTFELTCEGCGVSIRSGRYCEACRIRMEKVPKSAKHSSNITGGFASSPIKDTSGQKRFERKYR